MTSPGRGVGGDEDLPSWVEVTLSILVAGIYAPMSLAARAPTEIGPLGRMWALGLVWAAIGLLGFLMAVRLRVSQRLALQLAVFLLLVGAVAHQVASRLPGAYMGVGLGVVVGVLVLARLSKTRLTSHLVTGLTLYLALSLGGSAFTTWRSWGESRLRPPVPVDVELTRAEDVMVIVVDGYAGSAVLERDYGFDNSGFIARLEAAGFSVEPDLQVSYWTTYLAIPSILQMDYPLMHGSETNGATTASLHELIGGENALMSVFDREGYRTTVVESGWDGLRCDQAVVDRCVRAPQYGLSVSRLLEKSVLGPFLEDRAGSAFTRGGLRTMAWLESNVPVLASNGERDFIFAHILLPHPPLFLDSRCRMRDHLDGLEGLAVIPIDSSEGEAARRLSAYGEQVTCLNGMLNRLFEEAPEVNAIMVGDHGPDSMHQLTRDSKAWSPEAVDERMTTIAAIRGPQGCSMAGVGGSVNVGRRLLQCLSGSQVEELPVHSFALSRDDEGQDEIVFVET